MKMYLQLFGILLLSICCSSQQEQDIFDVTIKPKQEDLTKNGFKEVVGVDVIMFSKTFDKLTVAYQFEENDVIYKLWYFKLDTLIPDSEVIGKLLKEYHINRVTPIGLVNESESYKYVVFGMTNKNHDTLIAMSSEDEDGIKLRITYEYPMLDR